MGSMAAFNEVLEFADKLSLDEQETLTDILHRRRIDHRHAELVKEIQDAQQEFKEGMCKPLTPSEIMKEILS
ncbi:hypothetical protein HY793_02310 [Candidatus Desantisbacteria bacterium]|nr:hypothetical protein [Candidatus Desantisbacteria bacterium]